MCSEGARPHKRRAGVGRDVRAKDAPEWCGQVRSTSRSSRSLPPHQLRVLKGHRGPACSAQGDSGVAASEKVVIIIRGTTPEQRAACRCRSRGSQAGERAIPQAPSKTDQGGCCSGRRATHRSIYCYTYTPPARGRKGRAGRPRETCKPKLSQNQCSLAGPTVGPAPGNRSGRAIFAGVFAGAFNTAKKLSFEPGHVRKLAAISEIQPWQLGPALACSAQHQVACPAAAEPQLATRPSVPCSAHKGLSNVPSFTRELALAAEIWPLTLLAPGSQQFSTKVAAGAARAVQLGCGWARPCSTNKELSNAPNFERKLPLEAEQSAAKVSELPRKQ